MGARATQAAIEAADVALMTNELSKIEYTTVPYRRSRDFSRPRNVTRL